MTDKLKPCPFCGSKAELIEQKPTGIFRVKCTKCPVDLGRYWFFKKQDAITARDRPIGLLEDMAHESGGMPSFSDVADHLIANGVIVPPVEIGDEIWVIDREDGEAVDISCVMFLAKSKGCIIATSWINDYDLDETLEFHINETQNNIDTDLKVYPDEDCFLTKEEAEKALAERNGEE